MDAVRKTLSVVLDRNLICFIITPLQQLNLLFILFTNLIKNSTVLMTPPPLSPPHASYKGYGWNKIKKQLRSPHRKTIIDVGVLRCGQIQTGEGAAAPFNGVHILGESAGGGFDTLDESRWADLIGPSIPAEKVNHTTINLRGPLCVRRLAVGWNGCPVCGDGNKRGIFDAWVGRWKAWPIGDRAFHFNGSARSHSIKTAQSTMFGLVGAESPRQRRSGCILWRAFFRNYGRRGSFKASLNCHRADEFDCSARSLASKT